MSVSIVEHFSELKDPRIERKKLHALLDILVLSVCAIISRAEGWVDIAELGRNKLEWLRRFVPLENGVPSHGCIAYVISCKRINTTPPCYYLPILLHLLRQWH